MTQTHETLASFRKVEASSNRKFGLTIGAVLLALSVLPLLHHRQPHWWLLAVSAIFLIAGVAFPAILAWPNRLWFKLGLALNAIVSPIVMGGLFFGAVVPIGWLVRRNGEDILALRLAPETSTYWITRDPPGPASGSLGKQF
ncbi:MAG: SxtJ family membrane protein [Methylovirgula sp.]